MAQATTVLAGGHVIDPAQGIDGTNDVLVQDGRITAVAPNVIAPVGAQRIDCRGKLVLPGLIDTHAHVYRYVTGRFGLDADLCGVRSGVTTLIDQGGPSCITFGGFRHFIAEKAESRVLAYISAYLVGGMEGHAYAELYRPECVHVEATLRAIRDNADMVRGIKAHAEIGSFARWGLDLIKLSARMGHESGLPVYVHFGQLWGRPEGGGLPVDPDTILAEVVPLLKAGDVLAHPFSKHPGGFVSTKGELHPVVREALARGLKVDVGHGSHFSFDMARRVLDAGILPDTLGADMHGYNTRLPGEEMVSHMFTGKVGFSMASAMSAMLALGIPLQHVVAMATCNAAAMVGMQDTLGTLAPGREADVSVLHDHSGRWVMRDNEDHEVIATRMLEPAFCLKAGRRFDADAPILPVAQAA